MNGQDYTELLLEGIDYVIQARMREQKFDETIVCTIVDTSRANKGIYMVSNGTIKFDAYSEVTNYIVNQAVRVAIDKGDYSQKKYIVGRAVSEKNGNQPIVFNAPSSNILDISGNIFLTEVNRWELIANGNETQLFIGSIEPTKQYGNNIYDSLLLKAKFQTLFQPSQVYDGRYGLCLKVVMTPLIEGTQELHYTYYLDSKYMFGDPYNYLIPSSQEIRVPIEEGEISRLDLYLYQDANFKYKADDGSLQNSLSGNIIVSDIHIGLGTDLSKMEDNTIRLQTDDGLTYNGENLSNAKKISLLWYNKNEHDQYVGFSDGIVDKDYDELQYLAESAQHNRLISQKTKENIPDDYAGLELSARMNEIAQVSKQLKQLINVELYKEVQQFKNALKGIASDDFNAWITSIISSEINIKLDNLYGYYKQGLHFAYQVQNGLVYYKNGKYYLENEQEVTNPCGTLVDLEANLKTTLVTLLINIKQQLSAIKEETIKSPNYMAIYDNYQSRVMKFFDLIREQVNKISLISKPTASPDGETTISFQSSYQLFEEGLLKIAQENNIGRLIVNEETKLVSFNKITYESDIEEKNNRYSIYWYYYRKDYVPADTENYLGGTDWCCIDNIEVLNGAARFTIGSESFTNIGLPTPNDDKYPPKPNLDDKNGYLLIDFSAKRPDIKEEKIKAIIFYNHERYESNILTFTNDDTAAGPELTNSIQIVHGSNSQDTYALYGVDNKLINAADIYTQRQLKVQYLNERGEPESGSETSLAGGSIYWYVPTKNTMLKIENKDVVSGQDNFIPSATNQIFEVDLEKKQLRYDIVRPCELILDNDGVAVKAYAFIYNSVAYECTPEDLSKIILPHGGRVKLWYNGVTYGINIFYEYNIQENQSIAGLSYGGISYALTEDGSHIVSSNNIKYRIQDGKVSLPIDIEDKDDRQGFNYYYKRIETADDLLFTYHIQDYYSSSLTNNTIYCKVVKGNRTLEAAITMSFSSQGSSGTNYTLVIKPLNVDYGKDNSENVVNNYEFELLLFDYENKSIPFNAEPLVYLQDSDIYFNLTPGRSDERGVLQYLILKSQDGLYQITQTAMDNPKILVAKTTQPWPIDSESQVTLEAYYPIPYSTPGVQASVPTTIIYNSYGANPIYYKDPLCLYNKDTYELISEGEWTIECVGQVVNQSYIPYLQGTKNGETVLVPCNMYVSGHTICPILKYKHGENILYKQPLLIIQNRYPSAMLNNWDGNLEIDKENGTILSNLIGAGKKNDDNSFSGVLMGEVESEGGIQIYEEDALLERTLAHNHTGMGIYGFHEGAQSFGFNINGTAFLGKSGGGRISFDGTHGFIYSQTWLDSFKQYDENNQWTGRYNNPFNVNVNGNITLNKGSDGMAIDLQSGHIDAYNFRLTSGGIYLNSSPENYANEEDQYYFKIGNMKSGGYITLDRGYNLIAKLNSLELTGITSGKNLLNNTAPLQPTVDTQVDGQIIHAPTKNNITKTDGDKSAWTGYQRFASGNRPEQLYVWSALQGKGDNVYRCIGIDNISIKDDAGKWVEQNIIGTNGTIINYREIRQSFGTGVLTHKKYILSGYVWNDGPTHLHFRLGKWDSDSRKYCVMNYGSKEQPLLKQTWNRIEIIFDLSDKTNVEPWLYIQDYIDDHGHRSATYFRELKLEEGSVASPWCRSEADASQVEMINWLTNNGTADGIYLNNNNLYINASAIKTGIIKSKTGNAQINLVEDSFKLRADNYLNEEKTEKRIVLLTNQTVENSPYFAVGKWINNTMSAGIRYGVDNKLTILTDNFKVYSNGDVNVTGVINATSGVFDKCTINNGCTISGIEVKSKGIGGKGWSLNADGGTIGGWVIDSSQLYNSNGAYIRPGDGFQFAYRSNGSGSDKNFYFDNSGLTLDSGDFKLSWGDFILPAGNITLYAEGNPQTLTGDLIKKIKAFFDPS